MIPDLKWLEDPTVFRINRLDAHSDHVCYASVEEMVNHATSLRQCLDGQWKFHWSKSPALRPAQFWQEEFDLSGFDTIQVPGHMETQGYDKIQYINKLYPWDGHTFLRPPHIDWDYNPVGSYATEFDLDPALRGKPVCISFQGVEKAFFVWLNGHFVGYSEDTFTPSDFDLTPYIRETGNRLCVEVYKQSSASWLEDQDFFRFSGIFRSVYLYAKMPVSVDDLWLNTSLDKDLTTGRMTVRLAVSGDAVSEVHCRITHDTDGEIWAGNLTLTEKDGFLFSQELTFPNVRLWDYGTPELYHVLLTVENGGYIPYDVGFRRFEMVDKVMTLNGKRLIINGVNRHEWNASSGRCIEMADMEAAMGVFLHNNINAVRTCHYPNRSEWYFLCDQNGIYMMDETNLETHGSWQKDMTVNPEWNIPGSLPEWKDCVLDRANSMFQRDKNHISILFWSCGNEAFCGTNIVEMANFFRKEDPSRMVHYEGCYWPRGVVNGTPNSPYWRPEYETVSDMESRMYATPAEVREYLEMDPQKPYISCEYMHNMGNSLGGMESYVKMVDEFPLYQGGFIWDYMDQALWHKNAQGETVLGYGGDFGERQCDYNFSGNGIVTADGIEKPCMQEVRYWHDTPENRKAQDACNAEAAKNAPVPAFQFKHQPLKTVHGDGALGVQGEDFEILFSVGGGGPTSMVVNGKEWLWRAPRIAFWRAPTENDCGCGFPMKSAVWSAVDAWQKYTGREVLEETAEVVTVRYHFTADIMPDLNAHVTYRVTAEGRMEVRVHYEGKAGRPQLPLLGLRFSTPWPVEKTSWVGLSGETYPDRMKGSRFGTHEEVPHIAPYLVPQECGNHMDSHSTVFTMGGSSLTLEKCNAPYAFSAIPYTPGQLEQAMHRDELPAPCRTVVTVCGKMRGVGGIDTWMTDVEPQYHVSAEENIDFSFFVHL